MNIGDDRHFDLFDDFFQRLCRVFVGTGHADDIGADRFQRADLLVLELRAAFQLPLELFVLEPAVVVVVHGCVELALHVV